MSKTKYPRPWRMGKPSQVFDEVPWTEAPIIDANGAVVAIVAGDDYAEKAKAVIGKQGR